jgi:3-oxosteroid 1-dehydrogenase
MPPSIDNQPERNIIVVGSGLAGLAMAVAATLRGFKVTVLEKAAKVGGAASYSGGQVWVAGSHVEEREGISDDAEAAAAYIRATGYEHPELIDEDAMYRWLETAPRAAKYFEEVGAAQWEIIPLADYYYPSAAGSCAKGRYLTSSCASSRLGSWKDRILISPHFPVGHPYSAVMDSGHNQVETERRESESAREETHLSAFGAGVQGASDSGAAADGSGRATPELLTFGTGVVGGFLAKALELGVTILTDQRAVRLETDESGRVVAVYGEGADATETRFAGDVVLCTSGIDWSPELVAKYWGIAEHAGSIAPRSLTGDGLRLAQSVGADIITWPVHNVPLIPGYATGDDEVPYAYCYEHALPHVFIVDSEGQRFCDDTQHGEIRRAALDPDDPHLPMFLVWDEEYHSKYALGPYIPGSTYPENVVSSAPTLSALAEKLRVNGDGLERTAEEFNAGALRGEDPRFGRGTNLKAKLWGGDPEHEPNANLGTVARPPFYGLTLKMCGAGINLTGIHVDTEGRALNEKGQVIEGLFATGACAAFTTSGTGYNSGYSLSRAMSMALLVTDVLDPETAAVV